MPSQTASDVETRLDQLERELSLVIEIDRLRDLHARAPEQMLAAITRAVTGALRADAGLLALSDGSRQTEWGARFDPEGLLLEVSQDALQQVAGAAASLHTASALEAGEALQSRGVSHLLVTPLVVGGERLGSLVFLARGHLFSAADLDLLTTAASQADSAVLQARTWQELHDRSREVERRSSQLDVIYRVDRARDETDDPGRFLMQVADVLNDALAAELCIVGLVEEGTNQICLRSVSDRISALRSMGQQEIDRVLQHAASLSTPQVQPAVGALAEAGIGQMLVAPLLLNDIVLGAFVLANRERAFSSTDLELVRAIASQTDSAVIHLRTLQRAQERAQQLETIYRIDQIRDGARSEAQLVSAVANVVTEALNADLCLLSVVSEETGDHELRAIEDRHAVFGQLDRDAIESAIAWASAQADVAALDRGSPFERWRLRYVMGAPLVVAGEELGTLVLASAGRPFERAEKELLRAAASQMDSAFVHARSVRHLQQRNRELETLYRVDQIRDQGLEFSEMLSSVLSELCAAIEAEMGFIMLFDYEAKQLELRATTADDMLSSAGHYDLIEKAANRALLGGKLYADNDLSDWLHSIICIPLILREQIIGVFGAVNRRGPKGFTAEDKRLLLAITSQVDTAIFESLDKQRIRNTFQRYVGPSVMEQMLATPERDWLKGERAVLTVLFSDMRGFTAMSERVDVDLLVEMINRHLGAMTEVVLANDGTLDKFVADEVMAIFGAPVSIHDHATRAIRTALGMQEAQRALIREWGSRGYDLPPIGIGINTGEMVVGNIGCDQQMDYTVLGDVVNVASRLCEAALGDQILITADTYELVADEVQAQKLPKIQVKNREEPIQIYQVEDMK